MPRCFVQAYRASPARLTARVAPILYYALQLLVKKLKHPKPFHNEVVVRARWVNLYISIG